MSKTLKNMAEKHLDSQMHTNEFIEMVGNAVYDDPAVKAEDELHNNLLKNLNLGYNTLDPILNSINAMMARIMSVAYKQGFQDCISIIEE